jgi:anti-anti-sigma factor
LNFLQDHYIDSFGMTALVQIVTQARRQKQQLTLALSNEHTRRVLGLVGLNQYAKMYTNLEEALANLQ